MELRYGILSTSSIAPRFIAGVRESSKGQIVALSSRSLEKAKERLPFGTSPPLTAATKNCCRTKM